MRQAILIKKGGELYRVIEEEGEEGSGIGGDEING